MELHSLVSYKGALVINKTTIPTNPLRCNHLLTRHIKCKFNNKILEKWSMLPTYPSTLKISFGTNTCTMHTWICWWMKMERTICFEPIIDKNTSLDHKILVIEANISIHFFFSFLFCHNLKFQLHESNQNTTKTDKLAQPEWNTSIQIIT